MSLRSVLLAVTMIGLVAALTIAGGAREERVYSGSDAVDAPDGSIVEISGVVARVGSEPFSEIVLRDEAGNEWYVGDRGTDVLARLERERVTVRGVINRREMILADGRVVGTRLELTGLRLVVPTGR